MTGSVRLDYRFNADVTSVERKGDRITLNIANWRPLSFTPRTTALADAVMALAGPGAPFAQAGGDRGGRGRDRRRRDRVRLLHRALHARAPAGLEHRRR